LQLFQLKFSLDNAIRQRTVLKDKSSSQSFVLTPAFHLLSFGAPEISDIFFSE